jgi:tetratricopeptide (TPR) repeat protein
MSEKITKAQESLRNNKYRKALDLFMQEIADSPENSEAYFGAGQCLFMLKRPLEALAMADKMIGLNPSNVLSHVLKAEIYGLIVKDIQKSRQEIECAYSLEPTNPKVTYSYGHLLLHYGNWDEGIDFLEKAVVQDPKMVWAYYNLGLAYWRKGDEMKAFYYTTKVNELRPTLKNRIRLIYAQLNRRGLLRPIILLVFIALLVSALLHEFVLLSIAVVLLLFMVYFRIIFQAP